MFWIFLKSCHVVGFFNWKLECDSFALQKKYMNFQQMMLRQQGNEKRVMRDMERGKERCTIMIEMFSKRINVTNVNV